MGTKNVRGQGITCDYCGGLLETIQTKSKMHFCNADHAILWRKQTNFYAHMSAQGKPGRDTDIEKRKQTDFYKKMSAQGKAGRSRVMPQSNREKPRRQKEPVCYQL